MAESRLERALKQVDGLKLGLYPNSRVEMAIKLAQVEAIGELAEAVRDHTAAQERQAQPSVYRKLQRPQDLLDVARNSLGEDET